MLAIYRLFIKNLDIFYMLGSGTIERFDIVIKFISICLIIISRNMPFSEEYVNITEVWCLRFYGCKTYVWVWEESQFRQTPKHHQFWFTLTQTRFVCYGNVLVIL